MSRLPGCHGLVRWTGHPQQPGSGIPQQMASGRFSLGCWVSGHKVIADRSWVVLMLRFARFPAQGEVISLQVEPMPLNPCWTCLTGFLIQWYEGFVVCFYHKMRQPIEVEFVAVNSEEHCQALRFQLTVVFLRGREGSAVMRDWSPDSVVLLLPQSGRGTDTHCCVHCDFGRQTWMK